ncbi:GIY-YIG nuclease family protein [Dyella sp. GSA-30]|uniref:GIY-YIG nuclease family protein n=1 Tax=Dyella sp. GSA-30 TaxID=2994496 RepID=UPI0024903668|nr:GIY-YIG nuclease family protein [Dyella sp. GSA-30]BDU19196.1 hypothetical protein DYGSA30_06530 [Dyella sp. GSA-30]
MSDDVGYPQFASRGRAYVYVLPYRDEDLLKLGFSRDPFTRFHTLHRRFYEFFDLDRGLLIEVDRVSDARRIERRFIDTWIESRAPAPLVVREAAAGYTEWYRGIYPEITALAQQLAEDAGYTLHRPLRPWLRSLLEERVDWLYEGSARMLEQVEYERFHGDPKRPLQRALLNVLDMCRSIGLPLERLVPDDVLRWYEHGDRPLLG